MLVFLVHGVGGGMIWGYSNLGRHLGDDQPIYAFRSRGMNGLEEFTTIELGSFEETGMPYEFDGDGPVHFVCALLNACEWTRLRMSAIAWE